jgi:DNA gyrase subunit A
VRQTGRVTMGVRLMNLAAGNTVVALARNAESEVAVDIENGTTIEDIADDGNEPGDAGV